MEKTKEEGLVEVGACAMSSIREMVAALNCDYDRLEELRGERDDWVSNVDGDDDEQDRTLDDWVKEFPDDADELKDLHELDNAERLEKWIAGESVSPPHSEFDYMRVIPQGSPESEPLIQTTRFVTVPLKAVKKISKLVLKIIRAGQHWQRNGEHIPVGDYELSAITSEGTVHVGCHKFKKEEIERVAGLLGIK